MHGDRSGSHRRLAPTQRTWFSFSWVVVLWVLDFPLPLLAAEPPSTQLSFNDHQDASAERAQVGFARFISDFATFCYVCDVYVLEEHHQNGLAQGMMAMAMHHPKLQGLRRWNLVTRDAHGLYEKFNFTKIKHPERYMELLDSEVYQRLAESADE